jgi:hypothetical protein
MAAKKNPPKGKTLAYAQPPPAETPIESETAPPTQAAASVPEHGPTPRPPTHPPNAQPKPAARAAKNIKTEIDAPAEGASQRYSEEEIAEEEYGARAPFDPFTVCRFYAKGRCYKGHHCLYVHVDKKNTVDDPHFANCATHGHRRKQIFMKCDPDGTWKCDPEDNESYCHRARHLPSQIQTLEVQPRTLSPPVKGATKKSGPSSKAAARPPIDNRAPRGATGRKNFPPRRKPPPQNANPVVPVRLAPLVAAPLSLAP